MGPNLRFPADGTPDPDPLQPWGNGTLSITIGVLVLLQPSDIIPDVSMTLELLVEAYIPGGNQLNNPEKLMGAIIIKKKTMSLMGREDKKNVPISIVEL